MKDLDYCPNWVKEMTTHFRAATSHTFLLHLNINDYVYDGEKDHYISVNKYLVERCFKEYEIIVFYDCATGLHFASEEMKKKFIKIGHLKGWLAIPHGQNLKSILPRDPIQVLSLLEKFLRIDPKEIKEIDERQQKRHFIALIISFVEALAPNADFNYLQPFDRVAVISLTNWAKDEVISNSGNAVILMARSLSSVAELLRTSSSNIQIIKIPLPDRQARLDFIEWLAKKYHKFKTNLTYSALANITAGLMLNQIENLAKIAICTDKPLDETFVWDMKKKIIETESGGLIEVMQPKWGFDVIGGLHYVRKYLDKIMQAVKTGDLLRVPMGVLLVGPPGTGKTVVAEAFAKSLGFAMVKMKNIMEKWVGQSERNQDLAFEIIRAMAPVVVFEDEVDQKGFIRGETSFGDSGVSQRLFAAQLAFMSDTSLRGQVIWFSATNRPDLMDPALLREGRYDCKIPFLPPDEQERYEIFQAIFRKMNYKAQECGRKFNISVAEKDLKTLAEELEDYNGAEIEVICARAYDIAAEEGAKTVTLEHLRAAVDDFIPSRNEKIYQMAIDAALLQVNFFSMIPEKWRKRAEEVKERYYGSRMMSNE